MLCCKNQMLFFVLKLDAVSCNESYITTILCCRFFSCLVKILFQLSIRFLSEKTTLALINLSATFSIYLPVLGIMIEVF